MISAPDDWSFMPRLQGKIALISGAGRNSGRAIAITFAREGADLILVARQRQADLNQVVKECESAGVRTLAMLADVSQPDEVSHIVEQGMQRFGRIDSLVSVAAIRPHRNFLDYSYEEWLQVFSVNVHATFLLAKALAPIMMAQKSGSIVALGAVASLTVLPNQAVEVACKHSLYGLIKSIALELGPYGVRANLLALGHIENKRLNLDWYPKIAEEEPQKLALIPLGRRGKSQEVANVAAFLASDDASYITGDRIVCAGGRYM
jgi:3-oxoacyl-[acyl-carrier protein] reductase